MKRKVLEWSNQGDKFHITVVFIIVSLDDIAYFSQFNASEINYYLNLYSNNIEHIEDIVNMLGINKDLFRVTYYDYEFLPLPVADKINILKEFIKSMNNRKYSDYFSTVTDDDLWIEFDKKFPDCMERRTWDDFLKKRKKEIAENWCKENGIRFNLK